jgi:hypothetical protein
MKRTLQKHEQAKIPTEIKEIRTTIKTIRNVTDSILSIAIASLENINRAKNIDIIG